ncbi:MAG: hypothetical protein MI748_07845, partial [Opitutales bacterium]|nr:hypothetical protein [Opitutales bacterium]
SAFQQHADGSVQHLRVRHNDTVIAINAQRFVFAAGEGNEQLSALLNITKPAMQRRPLRQVLVKHEHPYRLYAHCMGTNASPRLTISSHPSRDGKMVWYLGGDLATDGATQSDDTVLSRAKSELEALFPWLDFASSEWATLYINRAEPQQKGLIKPDKAFAETARECANVIVGWPTKLTLSPNMADEVCALLTADNIQASGAEPDKVLAALPRPVVGTPCWDSIF